MFNGMTFPGSLLDVELSQAKPLRKTYSLFKPFFFSTCKISTFGTIQGSFTSTRIFIYVQQKPGQKKMDINEQIPAKLLQSVSQ